MFFFLLILFLIASGLLVYMLKQAFLNHVVEVKMQFPDFPATFGKFRIFFISDIHRRRINSQLIDKVKGQAEIVVIGGDLTEKGVPMKRVKENLMKLSQVAPCFFVWGNNDFEVDRKDLLGVLNNCGVKVLENTAVTIESERGEQLSLLGIADLNQHLDRLDLAVAAAGNNSFKILACHYPKIAAKIMPEHEIKLVLSGHTHGGQIHLFGYSPYKKGKLEKLENTTLLISNGYGTTAIPLRLGAPAECHLISLQNGEAESFIV